MLNGYKTIIGAAVAAVAGIATIFGIDIGDQEMLVNGIIVVGGAVMAVVGRFIATKKVGGGSLE